MSDPVFGRYHFLSWVRRGLATTLTKDISPLPNRAGLQVQLSVDIGKNGSTTTRQPAAVEVWLYGPGDVIGIDPRHIVRTEPRDRTNNFEPNYLCGIEFDPPELPWLFTPAGPAKVYVSPNFVDRLRPWLVLIVLKTDANEYQASPAAPNPLPVIHVNDISTLPDLSESWAWAHAQVSGDQALADTLASAPGNVVSRLLCPRRLDPDTSYKAFLVPAFEIGRQAGLGKDVSKIQTADPAWTKDPTKPPAGLDLPFYYQFTFHTSDAGDFESLVRRLTPRVLPTAVGQRLMDVSNPGPNIPSAGTPLGLSGALSSAGAQPTAWNDPDKTNFQSKVQDLLNQPLARTDDPAKPNPLDPVVAPPIYGCWHAAVHAVDRTGSGWVNDLNLDPRNRVPAGVGAEVVQNQRTQLLASAWQQVEGVLEANRMLAQAQLVRSGLQQVYQQHFGLAIPETVLNWTAPVHATLRSAGPGSPTITGAVRAGRPPERMLSGVFRRVTRPRRRIGASITTRTPLLTRINTGELSFVPPVKPPDGLVPIETISDKIVPWTEKLEETLESWWNSLTGNPDTDENLEQSQVAVSGNLRMSGFQPQRVTAVPARPNFQVMAAGIAQPGGNATGADSAQAAAFRTAAGELFTDYQAVPTYPPQPPALDLNGLRMQALIALEPLNTVPQRVQSLLSFSAQFSWKASDPLEPIMAAPTFPQAMYRPLTDLSQQNLLPGVEQIPADTLGLVVSNHAFIEAYMVGLNHEMARQLLWAGYPTDQRGSYFRQFWDVSAHVPQPATPADVEALKDIPPIHTWDKTVPLGQHAMPNNLAPDNVVLLVRGELLQRYPNAVIYAGKAKLDGNGNRVLDDTDERYPVFRGTLATDITFIGFNLTLTDARGGTAASPQGFFFVFQQQPSEPRFGLEPVESSKTTTQWSDLAWTNFATGNSATDNSATDNSATSPFQLTSLGSDSKVRYLQTSPWRLASQVFSAVLQSAKLPDFLSPAPAASPQRVSIVYAPGSTTNEDQNADWGNDSAQMAYILFRLPFRILIHAELMLPSS